LFLAYRKAIDNLDNDRKWLTDIAVGKRIGLYKLSGELGKGNFSQVKTGYHELTKGNRAELFFSILCVGLDYMRKLKGSNETL